MRYWFDDDDRLIDVDDDWHAFAAANESPHLTGDSVRGKHLSEFIADRPTVHLWEILLRRARREGALSVVIRCDSPDARRRLHLDLSLDGGRVRVLTRIVAEEARARMPLLQAGRPTLGLARCCSWCHRFLAADGLWREVEEHLRVSGLLERPDLPEVTHTICPACVAAFGAEGGALEPGEGWEPGAPAGR